MAMRNYDKIEDELTSQFKIHMRILTNLNPSTQKSRKFALSYTAFYQSTSCFS